MSDRMCLRGCTQRGVHYAKDPEVTFGKITGILGLVSFGFAAGVILAALVWGVW